MFPVIKSGFVRMEKPPYRTWKSMDSFRKPASADYR
jgi:hypothetical protein